MLIRGEEMEWASRRRYAKPTCSAPCTTRYSSEVPKFHKEPKEYSTYHSHTAISRNTLSDNPKQPRYVSIIVRWAKLHRTPSLALEQQTSFANNYQKHFTAELIYPEQKSRCFSKLSRASAFVRISARWPSVLRYFTDKPPFPTNSRKK